MKKIPWEHTTWFIIICITLIIVLTMPWYIAEKILPFIFGTLVFFLAFFYLKSRKLYLMANSKQFVTLEEKKKLHRQHKTSRKILDHSPDGILIFDEGDKITLISPALEKLSGFHKEEILGRKAGPVFKFVGTNNFEALTKTAFKDKSKFATNQIIENTITTKSGRKITVEINYKLIPESEDNTFETIAIIREKLK